MDLDVPQQTITLVTEISLNHFHLNCCDDSHISKRTEELILHHKLLCWFGNSSCGLQKTIGCDVSSKNVATYMWGKVTFYSF
jgi:hypothetical protein